MQSAYVWSRRRPSPECFGGETTIRNRKEDQRHVFDIIMVSGSEARPFLQGQLTQDIEKLGETPSLLAAWCNPKGRVIAVMRMIDSGGKDNELALAVPRGFAAGIVRRLLTFRFRARVDLGVGHEWGACAVSGQRDLEALAALDLSPADGGRLAIRSKGLVAVELEGASRCVEIWGPLAAIRGLHLQRPLSHDDWKLALIHAAIPTIEAATSEKFTPHMLNLDCLGAVSFNKGCYTGQEVVARTEHLGKSKRRLMHYRMEVPAARPGDRLSHDSRDVGEVVNVALEHLLAIVPVDLHGDDLTIDGRRASPVTLPYELPAA